MAAGRNFVFKIADKRKTLLLLTAYRNSSPYPTVLSRRFTTYGLATIYAFVADKRNLKVGQKVNSARSVTV